MEGDEASSRRLFAVRGRGLSAGVSESDPEIRREVSTTTRFRRPCRSGIEARCLAEREIYMYVNMFNAHFACVSTSRSISAAESNCANVTAARGIFLVTNLCFRRRHYSRHFDDFTTARPSRQYPQLGDLLRAVRPERSEREIPTIVFRS